MISASVGHIRIVAVISASVTESGVAAASARSAMTASEVTTIESVAHTARSATTITSGTMCEVASVIPTSAAVHPPTVTASVHGIEVRKSEVEVVAVGVAGIDAEMPVASVPVERAIEIGGSQIGFILPVKKDITQVEVTLCPICSIEVCLRVDTHQIVEVDLVCGLVLLLGEVEFIGHLVSEEQGLLAGLLVTHCAC